MAEANRDHRGRPAPAFYPGRPRRRQDEQPEADSSRALLRRSHSRAGLRAHGAARVQLSRRARTTSSPATRVAAAFRSPRCRCASPRRSRRRSQHPADGLPYPQQPDDDPAQCHGSSPATGCLHHMGTRSLPGGHRRPAGWSGSVDGYTTSDAHPYSRSVHSTGIGTCELHPQLGQGDRGRLRRRDANSTYSTRRSDDSGLPAPLSRPVAPASEMPADLRAHARYPETFFRVQAEIYRTYHMLDPRRSITRRICGTSRGRPGAGDARPQPVTPTYVVARLPGEDEAGVPADDSLYAAQ